eukprot:scaffold3947_cov179-Amphora_coffeaeformis.AAC.10
MMMMCSLFPWRGVVCVAARRVATMMVSFPTTTKIQSVSRMQIKNESSIHPHNIVLVGEVMKASSQRFRLA